MAEAKKVQGLLTYINTVYRYFILQKVEKDGFFFTILSPVRNTWRGGMAFFSLHIIIIRGIFSSMKANIINTICIFFCFQYFVLKIVTRESQFKYNRCQVYFDSNLIYFLCLTLNWLIGFGYKISHFVKICSKSLAMNLFKFDCFFYRTILICPFKWINSESIFQLRQAILRNQYDLFGLDSKNLYLLTF